MWVRKRACELANEYTYRLAAGLLSAEIGDEVSHGAVWGFTVTQIHGSMKLGVKATL